VQFQAHPLAWTRVDTIFQHSRNPTTKLLALDVLNSLVKSRWNLLPAEQKDGIKNFLINLIIQLSKEQKDFLANRSLLQRLNLVLVQVCKSSWSRLGSIILFNAIVFASRSHLFSGCQAGVAP